jgi:hypothetical protein
MQTGAGMEQRIFYLCSSELDACPGLDIRSMEVLDIIREHT